MNALSNALTTAACCVAVRPSSAAPSDRAFRARPRCAIVLCCVLVNPRPTSDVVSDDLSFVVRIVPRSAMPKTPPTSRLVFVMAEPSPARCGPTAFITAAVIGAMTEAMP